MKRKKHALSYILLLVLTTAGIAMFYYGIRFVSENSVAPSLPATEDTFLPTPTPPTPTPTPKIIPEQVKQLLTLTPQVGAEMAQRVNMFARFIAPDAGINVALFTDGTGDIIYPDVRQSIVDEQDSALLYYEYESGCGVIADHNNQSFLTLFDVQIGQKAYLMTAHSVIELECSRLIDGHNDNHKSIVDEYYAPLNSPGDFICYTCADDWQNVRIVVLDIIDEYFIN